MQLNTNHIHITLFNYFQDSHELTKAFFYKPESGLGLKCKIFKVLYQRGDFITFMSQHRQTVSHIATSIMSTLQHHSLLARVATLESRGRHVASILTT